MSFLARKPARPIAAPAPEPRPGPSPRPDCAIWNDIARALGGIPGQRK